MLVLSPRCRCGCQRGTARVVEAAPGRALASGSAWSVARALAWARVWAEVEVQERATGQPPRLSTQSQQQAWYLAASSGPVGSGHSAMQAVRLPPGQAPSARVATAAQTTKACSKELKGCFYRG